MEIGKMVRFSGFYSVRDSAWCSTNCSTTYKVKHLIRVPLEGPVHTSVSVLVHTALFDDIIWK